MNIIIIILMLSGTFFIFSSALGIIRFPDVFTRLHAATKAPTLGIMSILLATFLFLYGSHQIVSGKLLLAILFIFLSSPVGGHMLSRAAHKANVKPYLRHREDEYETYMRTKNKKQAK
ncbi:MAG TPA: monovalent cation/H(+) antiporter subunit G [Candidatus Pseudogracilibacillus intestinigallinarum]|uniref:Monovalent cation/H(+) antiporter subunit G n=2 Tax=Pseudogracilibacillus TaxID=1494958 RepID=A0A9D1TJ42_9BACI|nr:monovalent cation/H(+) antiporter subunit G [Candidatus Pseudogracilibacillus intestinigallinarum]